MSQRPKGLDVAALACAQELLDTSPGPNIQPFDCPAGLGQMCPQPRSRRHQTDLGCPVVELIKNTRRRGLASDSGGGRFITLVCRRWPYAHRLSLVCPGRDS